MFPVKTFLYAYAKEWLELMGCAAFTFLAVYLAATNRGGSWVVGGTAAFAVLFFIVASYKVWKRQYDQVEELRGRPEISLDVLEEQGEDIFRLTNASSTTATNLKVSPISDGTLVFEFEPVANLAPGNRWTLQRTARYSIDLPWNGENVTLEKPFEARTLSKILGYNKNLESEAFTIVVEFSNYGCTATWQVSYILQCNYKQNRLTLIPGKCERISSEEH